MLLEGLGQQLDKKQCNPAVAAILHVGFGDKFKLLHITPVAQDVERDAGCATAI